MDEFKPEVGGIASYRCGETSTRVMVTAHATYLDRVDSWRVEWMDTTGRPVAEWVEATQLSAI